MTMIPQHYRPFATALFGAFMGTLGAQLVSGGLSDIQGGLAMSPDEARWLTTVYSAAELATIPAALLTAMALSVRWLSVLAATAFALASFAGTYVASGDHLILARIVQGMGAGCLTPLAFMMTFRTFPPSLGRTLGLSLFALATTYPSAAGPWIAAQLIESGGWRTLFAFQAVAGAATVLLAWRFHPRDPHALPSLKSIDWPGYLALAVCAVALAVFLTQGNRYDWFESPMVRGAALIAVLAVAAFLWMEDGRPRRVIDLSLMTRRPNFGWSVVLNLFFRFGLLGAGMVMPQMLATLQGYKSLQVGDLMLWTAIPELAMFVVAYWLARRFDPRWSVAASFALFAAACLLNADLTTLTAADQFRASQVLLAAAQPLFIVPLLVIAVDGVLPQEGPSACTFFNGSRSLGQMAGTAILETLVTKREHFHSNVLAEKAQLYLGAFNDRIDKVSQLFARREVDDALAAARASSSVASAVRKQAYALAYGDTFLVIGVVLLIAIPAVLLLPRLFNPSAKNEAA